MRLSVLPLAACALFLACVPARADSDSVRAEIRSALIRWRDAFNTGDTRDVCSLFAPDLIARNQGQPPTGFDAVCDRLRRVLRDPERSFHYALRIDEILVSGDLAVARLVWTLDVRRKGAARHAVSEEVGMDVFRRQPDGSWKIARFVSYPSVRGGATQVVSAPRATWPARSRSRPRRRSSIRRRRTSRPPRRRHA